MNRILTLFASTGDVCKKPYPSERVYRKVSTPVQDFGQAFFYIREIINEVTTVLGLDISEERVPCVSGLTHQKLVPYSRMTPSVHNLMSV